MVITVPGAGIIQHYNVSYSARNNLWVTEGVAPQRVKQQPQPTSSLVRTAWDRHVTCINTSFGRDVFCVLFIIL